VLDNLINNYYFLNVLYSLMFILFSVSTIDYMKKRKLNFKSRISIKSIDYKFLLKITCFSFFIRILFEQIQLYFNIKQTSETYNVTVLSLITFFLVRCIIAPITEEIVFRFGLYEILNKRTKSVWAIIVSSIIFSVLHGYLTFDTVLLTILSVIWTYSYYKKENLFYPIIVHFFHNVYAMISFANINNIYYIIFGIACFIVWLILKIKKEVTKK